MSKKSKIATKEIMEMFADIIYEIPWFIESWADQNEMNHEIPYHYDVLFIQTKLKAGYSLLIELKRTITGAKAYYDNTESIMSAFKRAHIVISIDNTVKAYDLHLKYNAKEKGYYPLVMDIKRLREINEKYQALDPLVEAIRLSGIKSIPQHMTPSKCQVPYPHKMAFHLE